MKELFSEKEFSNIIEPEVNEVFQVYGQNYRAELWQNVETGSNCNMCDLKEFPNTVCFKIRCMFAERQDRQFIYVKKVENETKNS